MGATTLKGEIGKRVVDSLGILELPRLPVDNLGGSGIDDVHEGDVGGNLDKGKTQPISRFQERLWGW